MIHTNHEDLDHAELPAAAETIADRLLEALKLDYLNTLRAEGQIHQNLDEVFSSPHPPPQQMDGSGGSVELNQPSKSNSVIERSAKPAAAEAAPASASHDEEEEFSSGAEPRDVCSSDNDDEDACNTPSEGAEKSADEFAYQRLPSVEGLQSSQCFFDEADEEVGASTSSPENPWEEAEAIEDRDSPLTAAVAAVVQQAARASSASDGAPDKQNTAQASSFNLDDDESKKCDQGFLEANEEVGIHEQQQQQHPQSPTKPRYLLLGERPLEPQSAAFIAEVMRGLALKDPREFTASNPAN